MRIVALDELTLAYHRPAGATHLLAEPAPEVIAILQEDDLDAATLLDRLRDRFALADGDESTIAARLDELVAAGLVSSA
ncbi:MAG: HPr-rel-A system PqqD family peptide chaperone [Pseudomonadota bacterium]